MKTVDEVTQILGEISRGNTDDIYFRYSKNTDELIDVLLSKSPSEKIYRIKNSDDDRKYIELRNELIKNVEIHYYRELTSYRKLIGRPITIFRKVMRRLLGFLFFPILEDLKTYHLKMITLNEINREQYFRIKSLLADIWQLHQIDSTNNGWEFNFYYSKLRSPKCINYSAIDFAPNNFPALLNERGIIVNVFNVIKEDYNNYIKISEYDSYGKIYSNDFNEKTLEHFVAYHLLDLHEGDIFVDIGSSSSPAPEIYEKLFGVKAYKQDLIYKHGVNGNLIGGDATDMPVPNGFADKMSLHCSYEHFEGDADILFIKEAARVLKPNGKVCILPLYTANYYSIVTDPIVAVENNVMFEESAILNCVENYGQRHGRLYDINQFMIRVYENVSKELHLEVFNITGVNQISAECYLNLALVLTKKS